MARVGRYNVSFNRRVNMGAVIMQIIGLTIALYVGDQVISSLRTSLFGSATASANIFYSAYEFLGLITGQTNSIIGIFGIIGAAVILMNFIKINRF